MRHSLEYRQVRSYLMWLFLMQEAQDDLFQMDDADGVLSQIRSWREDPTILAPDVLSKDSGILTLLRDEVPPVSRLLRKVIDGKSIFPEKYMDRADGKKQNAQKNGRMRWVSRPIPRQFHAMFFPCIHSECVKDNVERWLVPAIEGARFWYTERNGEVTGSAQLIPIELAGKKYMSLDLSSPDFSRRVGLEDTESSDLEWSSIFSRWQDWIEKRLPHGVSGLVSGQSTVGDNGLSLRTAIHPSSSYRMGTPVGKGRDTVLSDPIIPRVVAFSTATGTRGAYGGNMIFDAVIPQNAEADLIALAPAGGGAVSSNIQHSTSFDFDWEYSVDSLARQLGFREWVRVLHRGGLDPVKLAGSIDYRRPSQWPRYVKEFEEWEPETPREVLQKERLKKSLLFVPLQFTRNALIYFEGHRLQEVVSVYPNFDKLVELISGVLPIHLVHSYRRDLSLMKLPQDQFQALHDALYVRQYQNHDFSKEALKSIDLKTLLAETSRGKEGIHARSIALPHLPIERLPQYREEFLSLLPTLAQGERDLISFYLYHEHGVDALKMVSLGDLILLQPSIFSDRLLQLVEGIPPNLAAKSLRDLEALYRSPHVGGGINGGVFFLSEHAIDDFYLRAKRLLLAKLRTASGCEGDHEKLGSGS